ncbi:MAG: hypothetical protein IPK82_20715 [Polyangiaceae bacterium]|nr:hypothetical protein [Polyangiaceae bacterium]
MAKRTGSTARGANASRGMERKDLTGPRPAVAKAAKKRAAPDAPPTSRERARRSPKVGTKAVTPPRSTAQEKHGTKGAARASKSSPLDQAAQAGRGAGSTNVYASSGVERSRRVSILPLPSLDFGLARVPARIPTPPLLAPRSMELEWTGDPGGSAPPPEAAFDRWVRRGDELLRRLAEHGAATHEYRANLAEGMFCWIDPEGRVSAQAQAALLCTFNPQTQAVKMGWADPQTRRFSLPAIAGMVAEVDDVDEEAAWHIAMAAADHSGAQYIYRVRSPAQCVFVALSRLTFSPDAEEFVPATPVSMVLATLHEVHAAACLRAEPLDTFRARVAAAGAALLEHAEYVHRDTDWVARLERTGKRLRMLAEQLPRPTFFSVAKGANTVWLEADIADELAASVALLEEEWRQFK